VARGTRGSRHWSGVQIPGIPGRVHCVEQVTPLPSGAQSSSVVHRSTQAGPLEPQTPSAAIAENVMQTRPAGQVLPDPASPPAAGAPASGPQGVNANGGELEHAGKPNRMATSAGVHIFIVVACSRRFLSVPSRTGPPQVSIPEPSTKRKEPAATPALRYVWVLPCVTREPHIACERVGRLAAAARNPGSLGLGKQRRQRLRDKKGPSVFAVVLRRVPQSLESPPLPPTAFSPLERLGGRLYECGFGPASGS
jgi:hypothetical protein